tara:strand:- start:899 stop:5164 length:4266 start_codon:yes stop_codon:yes gene_type:complete
VADPNFFKKLLKGITPTEEQKEEFLEGKELSERFFEVYEKEGYFRAKQLLEEQRAIEDGASPEELEAMAYENDKAIMPKIEKFIKNPIDSTVKTVKDTFTKKPKIEETPRELGLPPEEDNEVSLGESFGNAVNSGLIKIPKGVINFGTLVYDALQDEGIPVEQGATYKFNKAFEDTYLGIIEKESEEKANETVTGKITEALVSLYGAGKIAQKTAVPVVAKLSQKARQLAPILTGAIKQGKYLNTSKNTKTFLEAGKKATQLNKLNKLSKLDKFVGITIGGGLGVGALVAKEEDIGTFGDFISFIPTKLDRESKEKAGDDALRQLHNKLLFGAEYGFPIIPAILGIKGMTAKLMSQKGNDLMFSNSLIDRWIDKFASKFRSRSFKDKSIFTGIQKLEGTKSSLKLTADDFGKNIDDSLKRISRETIDVAERVSPDTASGMIANFMLKTTDRVSKGKIFFDGFNSKVLKDFTTSMKKIGVSDDTTKKVIKDAVEFRTKVANIKNDILQGGNINQGANEFNKIITNRVNKFLVNDYKIVDANKGLIKGFKQTDELKEEVGSIIQRYYKAQGAPIDKGRALDIVNNIIKQVKINPIEKTPVFPLGSNSIMADKGVIMKNLADNVTGAGKFKPDGKGGLIQKESDLTAFKKLFGEYKNAKNIVYNTMGDLAQILGRDKFYNNLFKENAINIANGGRGIFRKSYDEALQAFPNKEILSSAKGLKLETRLSDEVYTSPLDGLFTTKEWAEAIKQGDEILATGLAKSAVYRYLVLVPKGLTQVGKTVLGPVTQIRNFTSNFFTTLHNGNLLYFAGNPKKFVDFLKKSTGAIQPQLFRRNTPEGQALYKFLLEEGVTNQSATFRDVEGILTDIAEGGAGKSIDGFVEKVMNTGTEKIKKAYNVAQELYVGGDDFFRVFNFLGEGAKLKDAYTVALKNGLIKKMPDDLFFMKEAAKIVRETIPNYAYVSDVVKGFRRSPLGNFASFPSEIYRTGTNNLVRGIKEAKDPILAPIGKARLTGQALTYITAPIVAVEGFRALYGITRDQLDAIREFVPNWSKDNLILPVYENGKYKYIDFSHGFFYDTMVAPVTATVNKVDELDEKPLLEGLTKGMIRAFGKAIQPFVSESIYVGAVADIFMRNGIDENGNRVFNPRDTLGNQLRDAFKHVAYKLSPGSFPQLKRIYKAAKGETIGGTLYEIPDELMGFFGMREVPIDIKKTMNFKITDFLDAERDERQLIYDGTLTGDPVEDDNLIIQQFIKANMQRLETFNSMRRTYDAAKFLGMKEKDIEEIFKKRGRIRELAFIRDNKFKPFAITRGYLKAYQDMAEEKGIPNPLNKRILKTIDRINKKLRKQRLNKDFRINPDDYILKQSTRDQLSQLPPNLPMPNQQVIQTTAIPTTGAMNQGLTAVENVLLSDEEKQIRLRQRGLA